MRDLAWGSKAWQDYLYWQQQDKKREKPLRGFPALRLLSKKTLKRINKLIQNTLVTPFEGIGKPEPLKENLSGYWSRRIDETNRLVYRVDDKYIKIISCRYHY